MNIIEERIERSPIFHSKVYGRCRTLTHVVDGLEYHLILTSINTKYNI